MQDELRFVLITSDGRLSVRDNFLFLIHWPFDGKSVTAERIWRELNDDHSKAQNYDWYAYKFWETYEEERIEAQKKSNVFPDVIPDAIPVDETLREMRMEIALKIITAAVSSDSNSYLLNSREIKQFVINCYEMTDMILEQNQPQKSISALDMNRSKNSPR